jgi:hypothetical protein
MKIPSPSWRSVSRWISDVRSGITLMPEKGWHRTFDDPIRLPDADDAIHFEPERVRLEAEMNKLVKKLMEEPLGGDDKAALASSAVRRA